MKLLIKGDTFGMKQKVGKKKIKQFFTLPYHRTYERPISIFDNGLYFKAFDGKAHTDNGILFYTDDWIWDIFRATHPLRVVNNIRNQYSFKSGLFGNNLYTSLLV